MRRFWQKARARRSHADSVSAEAERLVGLLSAQGIDHVLDVGANVGQYAIRLRSAGYRGRITSFEPVSRAYGELASAAAGDPLWSVAPRMALASASGRALMRVSNRSDMSSLRPMTDLTLAALPKSFETSREEVETVRLDAVYGEFVRPGERILLKIDAQGSEAEILEGSVDVIEGLAGLQVELSLQPMYEGERTYLDICRWIEDRGFEAFWFTSGNFSKRLGRQLQFDGIFFRR